MNNPSSSSSSADEQALPPEFPRDQIDALRAGQLVQIPKGLKGIQFWLSLGRDVGPLEAAALWWDVPAQMELFGGTFEILSGALTQPRFEGEFQGDLPGTGTFVQRSFYSVSKSATGSYRIVVDAFQENILWKDGLGVYRFYRLGDETLYEGTSLYDAKVSQDMLNQVAVGAALAHRQRLAAGARPTPEQIRNLELATKS